MTIRFPNLYFYVEDVPRAYRILGMEFTLFGAMIAAGMFLGLLVIWVQAGRQKKSVNLMLGAFLFACIGGLIGARLLYVAAHWDSYSDDILKILNIREGGLEMYGGIIGGMLFVMLFCLVARVSFYSTADVLVLGLALGQAVGSWGSYFNRSSFGEYTDWLWAMQLPVSAVRPEEVTDLMRENLADIQGVSYIQVTPVFFIESVLCLILFAYLLGRSRKRLYDGQIYVQYMVGFGLIYFLCEWLRTDKLMFPGLDIGAGLLISLVFVVYFGLQGMIRASLAKKREAARREVRERHQREESGLEERIREREETARPDYSSEEMQSEKAAARERIKEEREAEYRKELDEKLKARIDAKESHPDRDE